MVMLGDKTLQICVSFVKFAADTDNVPIVGNLVLPGRVDPDTASRPVDTSVESFRATGLGEYLTSEQHDEIRKRWNIVLPRENMKPGNGRW